MRGTGGSARRVNKGCRVYGAGRDVVEQDGGYAMVYGRLPWSGESVAMTRRCFVSYVSMFAI